MNQDIFSLGTSNPTRLVKREAIICLIPPFARHGTWNITYIVHVSISENVPSIFRTAPFPREWLVIRIARYKHANKAQVFPVFSRYRPRRLVFTINWHTLNVLFSMST
ncbi:hypothetical protein TWF173_005411 [Orbilia oligospora]|nr:hypothetical protein TWF173_005411 [Orbilia oligospora]